MTEEAVHPEDEIEAPEVFVPGPASRRRRLVEIAIVLFLTIFPAVRMCFLFDSSELTGPSTAQFTYAHVVWELVYGLLWILPAAVLIAVAPEGAAAFGVRPVRWNSDVGLGIVGMLACLAAWAGLMRLYMKWGWTGHGAGADPASPDAFEVLFCVLATAINCFGQELTCRAHLQTRLTQALGPWIGIPVSVALFASIHIYQGPRGLVFSSVFGLLLALQFRLLKSIWPCVVTHTLWNIAVYLVPW